MIRPVILALQSLTLFPERVREPSERDVARAAWLYPAVGLGVGAVQTAVFRAAESIGVGAYELVALVALLAGTLVSRSVHLRGASLCCRRWSRGAGNEGAEAPRDGAAGPGETIAAVFLILLKWQLYVRALSFLGDTTFPLVTCCLGRWGMVAGALKARAAGEGRCPALAGAVRLRDVLIAAAIPVLVAVWFHRWMAAALLPVAVAIAAIVRFGTRNRGGMTTDVADFVNETVELTALVLLLFQPLIAPFIG